jgi:hypothetical protein
MTTVSDIAAKRAELKRLTVSVVDRRRELKALDAQLVRLRSRRPVHKRTTTMHDAVRSLGAARLHVLDAS